MGRFVFRFIALLVICSMLISFSRLNIVNAAIESTIYIRADGSIEPSTANITNVDNATFVFTDNNYNSIVIEKDNIIVDGAGYTLQGTGSGTGIDLSGRSNVTIKNMQIEEFYYGIWL